MFSSKEPRSKKTSRKSAAGQAAWQWNHVHLTVFLLVIASALSLVIGVLLYWFVSLGIPDVSSVERYQPPATTVILDDRGQVVERLFRQNRYLLPLAKMPEYLVQAFVAAEDARFYDHSGVDAWSTLRALINNLREGGKGQGGSTITQQVTRALLLSREKTYIRKLKEAILAYRIDSLLSKNDILYIYLNEIYLGEGSYGVEAAAQTYFGKNAAALDLAEASLLAGLPQAPSRYSPFKNHTLAKRRQAYVLNRMAEDGYITSSLARKAYEQPLLWASTENLPAGNEYYLQQVKNYVTAKYGTEALLSGGLVVETTLNREMQQVGVEAVRKGVAAWQARHGKEPSLPQAALVAVQVGDGSVRALVGGTDFGESQFNRAVQAHRQPGSAFKPFVYAAALVRGLTPATMIVDEPLHLPGSEYGTVWSPKNFNDKYHGAATLRDGLVYSLNSATIKLMQEVGIDKVVLLSRKFGIKSELQHNFSLALGASEVTLLELTGAYAALANGGTFTEPAMVTKIIDRSGRILERRKKRQTVAVDERIAFQLTNILQKVILEGTGRQAGGLPVATAGKTGTTDRNMDAWFIGYTPELAVGVWVGFDQGISLGKGETGGRLAAPIWREFLAKVADNLKKKEFSVPTGITVAPVNLDTGEIVPFSALETSKHVSREIFLSANLPNGVEWIRADRRSAEQEMPAPR